MYIIEKISLYCDKKFQFLYENYFNNCLYSANLCFCSDIVDG